MSRQPDGNRWSQWLRKIDPAENPRRVSSAGQRPPALAGKAAGDWLAQRHALESQFPLNVQDVVSQGAWPGVSLLRGLSGDTRRRIGAVLERVGLASLAKTPIEALSGGQFQRMLFARVMVQRAPLVMLDEPFTGIDEATSRELMELILDMHRQGQTILAVLHDNQRVADFFPETLLLTRQRACWGATRAVLPAFSQARSA